MKSRGIEMLMVGGCGVTRQLHCCAPLSHKHSTLVVLRATLAGGAPNFVS